MALQLFSKKFIETAAIWYKRTLATELNKIGTCSLLGRTVSLGDAMAASYVESVPA